MNRRRCAYVFFGLAAVSILVSMPCVFLGVLGLIGIAADVSVAENRQIGSQSLQLAMIPFGLGVVMLAVALVLKRSK